MNCRDAKANASQCSEAKVIQCGDNFITNNFKVQESQFSDCSTGSYNYGDWFTFIGDGSTWNFLKTIWRSNPFSFGICGYWHMR